MKELLSFLLFGFIVASEYICQDSQTLVTSVDRTSQIRDPDYQNQLECQPGEDKDHVVELNLAKVYINTVHPLSCTTIHYLNSNRGTGPDDFPLSCVPKAHNRVKGKALDRMIDVRARGSKLSCDETFEWQGEFIQVLEVFTVIDQMFLKIFSEDAQYLSQTREVEVNLEKMHNWWDNWASDWGCRIQTRSRRPAPEVSRPTNEASANRVPCRTPKTEFGGQLSRQQQTCLEGSGVHTDVLGGSDPWVIRYLTDPNAHLNSKQNGSGPHITCRKKGSRDYKVRVNMALGRSKDDLLAWVDQCCEPVGADVEELTKLIGIAKDQCRMEDYYP